MPGIPKTLTRGQFQQTTAAKKPGATYQTYLRFLAAGAQQRAIIPRVRWMIVEKTEHGPLIREEFATREQAEARLAEMLEEDPTLADVLSIQGPES